MIYLFLVHIVVFLHLVFILSVPLGGLLVLWRRWWAWIHLPIFIWGVMISFYGWICPLTPLENWLRARGGMAGYQGGFIENYLLPVIYPVDLTRKHQITMGIVVLLINLVVYGLIIYRTMKRRGMGNGE